MITSMKITKTQVQIQVLYIFFEELMLRKEAVEAVVKKSENIMMDCENRGLG